MTELAVRDAVPADAEACAAVYAPYVRDTTTTLELEPPSVQGMRARIDAALATHSWLVLEDPGSGRVLGYATAGPWKARGGYLHSCEVGLYVGHEHSGKGGGRALYSVLLERLAQRGFRTVVAQMTEPNEPSTKLHLATGFEYVGTLRRVGFKQDRWLDVSLYQRFIGPSAG